MISDKTIITYLDKCKKGLEDDLCNFKPQNFDEVSKRLLFEIRRNDEYFINDNRYVAVASINEAKSILLDVLNFLYSYWNNKGLKLQVDQVSFDKHFTDKLKFFKEMEYFKDNDPICISVYC